MANVILDHVDGISYDPDVFPMRNMHAIDFMPVGLFRLASMIKAEEARKLAANPNVVFEAFCAMDPLIPCSFGWFAVSLVNHIRLIGFVDVMNKNGWGISDISLNRKTISSHCASYVSRVVPDIYTWRNKVAAHFAATDPFPMDNMGTLEQSLMNNVGFINGRICVNAGSWVIGGQQANLPCWSLTRIYEDLIPRFWPESILDFSPDKCVPPNSAR